MAQLQRLVVQPHQLQESQLLLTMEQHHYLRRVLRLGVGDRFIAMNGQGQAWLAQLLPTDSEAQATILEAVAQLTELPISVTLVAALPKGNGFDEVVRQATELGVARIEPVISDRTLLKPSVQKWERWQRIADEAAEQSERQSVPVILQPQPWAAHLEQMTTLNAHKYFCAARGTTAHLLDRLLLQDDRSPVVVATGPEGGWTEAEVEQAIAAGYQPVSLGSRILRAVTAPLAALSLIAAIHEKMSGE